MTPQDEQSRFRRTSDMFFYLRTHGVFSMTGFFRTFVPQCCNHGAEFFRPPQKCHKSASGKNSLYCESGILSISRSGHGSKPFSCETEGQQRLSDGLARRWRRALGKKSPWICRSGTGQSVSDIGADALQLDGKIESLFAPEGASKSNPLPSSLEFY